MADKRILIADADPRLVQEFRLALGRQWEVTIVTNGAAALEELKKTRYDALVAGLGLPGLDGDELLNSARKQHSATVRFILASETDRERVLKNVMGAHQFLTKPFDRASLQNTIERALALDTWIESETMRQLVTRIRTFPAIPSLYFEVLSALRSPNATTDAIGALIARDMAMTTKLLQVINSTYFALPRQITEPADAVGLLGFETTKSLILAVKLLNQNDKIKPSHLSLERLWRHSLEVARMAKELVWLETNDRALADAAYAGGLLHDLGKVVLASNFGEQYKGAQSLARKQGLAAWEVEKEVFGASHGEVGAYLLGLWGMPVEMLEVAALHHHPSNSITKQFTSLAAVHVANVFQHEAEPDPDSIAPQIDRAYLAEIGFLNSLAARREAVSEHAASESNQNPEPEKVPPPQPVLAAPVVRSAKPVAAPVARKITAPCPAIWRQRNIWLYASAAAAVVLLFVLLGQIQRHRNSAPLPVQARTLSNSTTEKSPVLQKEPAAKAQEPASSVASDTETIPHEARDNATKPPSAEPVAAVTPKPAPVVTQPSGPTVKLQGIFYSAANPVAIINGERVRPKDYIGGAQVLEIRPGLVIIEYEKQRLNLTLE